MLVAGQSKKVKVRVEMNVNNCLGQISKIPIDYKTLYRTFCSTDISKKYEELETHSKCIHFECSYTSNLDVDDIAKSISANKDDMEKHIYLVNLNFSEEVSLHENYVPALKDAIMQAMSKEVRLEFSYSPKSQFLFEDTKLQINIFEFVQLDD